MGPWTMSVTSAPIGQFLLPATAHGACTSPVALSLRRASAFEHMGTLSAVSKNSSNSF